MIPSKDKEINNKVVLIILSDREIIEAQYHFVHKVTSEIKKFLKESQCKRIIKEKKRYSIQHRKNFTKSEHKCRWKLKTSNERLPSHNILCTSNRIAFFYSIIN